MNASWRRTLAVPRACPAGTHWDDLEHACV
jgi:hypothetical protein